MRSLSQGATRLADARAHRRAHVDGRVGRGRSASGTSRLIGAIVAGGAASRFGGEPKGLHTVGGRRIIDRVVDALTGPTSEVVVITGAPDAESWLPGVRVIPDAWRKQGSLVGIHTALNYAQGPILVVAWDMPFVTRPLIELLHERSTESEYATIPESAPGSLEPFCAIYTPACLPMIEAQLGADDLRLGHMLEVLPSFVRVSVNDVAQVGVPARLFFNVNSAEDLARAEQMATAG